MQKQLLFLAVVVTLLAYGCKSKDNTNVGGKGGNATINVYPQHHTIAKNLINMKVYIKYNTTDKPANDVYDDSLSCTNHDSLSSCTFTGLKNGNYYFYGYGYDTSISQNVKGGLPYTITLQQTQDFDLPVSEN